jgi:hypothetical protein
MCDFVREIGKKERARNVGDIVELSIQSLVMFEE